MKIPGTVITKLQIVGKSTSLKFNTEELEVAISHYNFLHKYNLA